MPEQQPTSDEPTAAGEAFEQPSAQLADDRAERDAWLEEDEELPPRARRRVLAPLPLALLAALAIACGFIAGVLVEKGQEGGSGSTAGAGGALASRIAALRGGAASGSATAGSSSSSGTGSGSADRGLTSGARGLAGGAGGAATVGQVAYTDKGTLYVTTSEGNTVKVTAAAGASVTKTVKTSIKAIHPGETVIVAGTSSASGAVSASSIRAGGLAGAIGGGSALFGGSGGAAGGSSSGSSSSSAGATGGEPQLFGKG
ncbi:MAG TPA: hypothetical protein VN817_06980 [Solirubrobacteraceae bacterium]|nr:hypothetical protein [Solirubrobacteraceae bacterium]